MGFKDLPLKMQEIAAECLADKISYMSGFAEGSVKNEPAKDQARQVREAFIELYADTNADEAEKPRPGFSTECQAS
ncbi:MULTISPECIES: hypothetical protein [Klebsiella pneumoniae complex]|uniref:hypothetical protein n=1 Tax=Klebsiella pneumoniae complex TaxID=3390273 RepID=UPI001C11DDED|nr:MULTISPECIES: hypothetical protein [Klebsiella]HCI6539194.1 hypothetical protein [Klebsiella variicola subsp. variicola]MBU5394702.1 hypothetical protein [Klebsiella quasipneumoniae]MBV7685953.1 hypothetical protein [Klebsiella quasipneumoniae subsp. similipneumoniae]MCL7688494.1 hypothetical protein [Klebsiella quasivariicola]MCY0049565.1 hypothetical protein [Klebsiella quasipneumoniae]